MTSDLRVTNALPKLPGFTFSELSQPASHRKQQVFHFNGGIPLQKEVVPLNSAIAQSMLSSATAPSSCGIPESLILEKNPGWVSLADKVLRFFGYFTERVEESPIEKMRVRKVTILFYLKDGSIAVSETPAVQNSGLKIGTLMKKNHEPSINLRSLYIGESIDLRSRVVHLVDCDAATREFYLRMEIPQPPPSEYPPDNFEALKAKQPLIRDPDHIDMKRHVEMQAAAHSGHQASFLTPEEREKARNFLEHDREVLCFKAVWDRRMFRLQYYVADGTIAVMADHAPNSGRDTNRLFIKKAKIPKGKIIPKSIDTINSPRSVEPSFFTDLDLATGTAVNLLDREFILYDCDRFTTEYYKQKYGIEQKSYEKPETDDDKKSSFRAMSPPPRTSFGTDDDSMQSFRSLVMKPPRKDIAKFLQHQNNILRFSAVHDNPSPENADRKFIVCFYLADDSVSIYEHPGRNSGHVGGKIFTRSVVKGVNIDSFYVGSVIKLGGQRYVLQEMDERSEKFLNSGIAMGSTPFDVEALLLRVRKALTQRFSRATEAYHRYATSEKGLSLWDLQLMFRECEVKVESDDQFAKIMEYADNDRDGSLNLLEFLEHILGHTIIASTAAEHSMKGAESLPGASYEEIQLQRTKADFANKILKLFVAKLNARRAFIVDTFRIVSDRAVDGLIGVDSFKQVVREKLSLGFTDEELDALVYKFFYVPGIANYTQRRLSLREFRRIVEQ
jgi:hypothetical protein